MCARVAGACAAGAGFGDCGVLAAAALARGMAGEGGFRPAGGAAGAEGRGVVSGGGPPRAGPAPRQPRPGSWRLAGRSGRAERPARAPAGVVGAGECGRQAASGTPQRLLPGPPVPGAASCGARPRGLASRRAALARSGGRGSHPRSPTPAWAPRGTRWGPAGHCPARGGRAGPGAPARRPHRTAGTHTRGAAPARPGSPGGPRSSPALRTPCASVHAERCTSAPLLPTIGWSAMNHIILSKETLNGD